MFCKGSLGFNSHAGGAIKLESFCFDSFTQCCGNGAKM
jgi:hypothetical protein